MVRIFNTLTRRKEDFVPLEEGRVRMYVCGPTVYNLIHIGNARPMIFFDTVRRYFEYRGYSVKYVSNFTDVDDKIIAQAESEGVSATEISERYIEECKKDMEALNVRPADVAPLATQEIDGMVDMISELIKKGYAYETGGTVYFSARKSEGYGKLSGKNLDELQSGQRQLKVTGEEQKRDPLDFVLWKPKKEGEPYWASPWGDGRPGWHIECSVMSRKYLGEQIDIHGGGEDLIFPHHENEIAQSEAASGRQFAVYWMHNAFLKVDNVKMSKSLGNFFTVRDIISKYDPQVLRFFMLSAHYRSPLNFSEPLMHSAAAGLERIRTAAARLSDICATADSENTAAMPYIRDFEAAMDDDFNTADAISAAFELIKYANTAADAQTLSKGEARGLLDALNTICGCLGITASTKKETLDADIQELINRREAARKAKDYKTADAIRDSLLSRGIVLKDTRDGVKWSKV